MSFTCPRCGTTADETYYGPCATCRGQLRASLRGEARAAGDTAFEPSLHVTPNAVALKDD